MKNIREMRYLHTVLHAATQCIQRMICCKYKRFAINMNLQNYYYNVERLNLMRRYDELCSMQISQWPHEFTKCTYAYSCWQP